MTLHNKNKEKGFTLIEIMVVIIIMGILASIVAVNVIDRIEDAKRTKARTQIETFKSALKIYKADNGSYPDQDQGLDALVAQPTIGKLPRNWKGPYIESHKVPNDPWGNEYRYIIPGGYGDYDIISFGDDGQLGGEEKDADVNSWDVD